MNNALTVRHPSGTRLWTNPAVIHEVAGAVSLAVLLAAIAVAARFVADDWTAVRVLQESGIGGPLGLYSGWSGRFTANLGLVFVGLTPALAGAVPLAVGGALVATIVAAARRFGHPQPLIAGAAALAVLILLAPQPGQDFAWPTGTVSYTLGLALAAAIVLTDRPAVAAVLAFLAAGTSETMAFALVGALAVAPRSRLILAGALLGLVVVAVAPGNAERTAMLEPRTLVTMATGTLAAVVAIGAYLVAGLVAWIVTRRRAILVGLAGAVAAVIPSAIMLGAAPPGRALIIPIAFVLGGMAWGVRWRPPVILVAGVTALAALLLIRDPWAAFL